MNQFISLVWSERRFRWPAYALITLISVLLLLSSIINWYGRKRFDEAKQSVAVAGETLDFKNLLPPVLPAEQNFCAVPGLLNLADEVKGETAAEALKAFSCAESITGGAMLSKVELPDEIPALDTDADAIFAQFVGAFDRPYSRWTPQWRERELATIVLATPLPQYKSSTALAKGLALRSMQATAMGDTARAVQGIRATIRVAEASMGDPFLIGLLVGLSSANSAADAVWHLAKLQKAAASDYAALANDLARLNVEKATLHAWRGEMCAAVQATESLATTTDHRALAMLSGRSNGETDIALKALPSGFFYLNGAVLSDLCVRHYLLPQKEGGLRALAAKGDELRELLINARVHYLTHPGHIFAGLMMPATAKITSHAIYGQAVITMARAACLLEAGKAKTGSYPQTLPASDLIDPWTGRAFGFRLTSDGRYKLWSVGPDGKDDGGECDSAIKDISVLRELKFKGDWVWRYDQTAR